MDHFIVDIVYFINTHVNPASYQFLLKSQLRDLVSTGLMDRVATTLWVEGCTTDPMFAARVHEAIGPHLMVKTRVTTHHENNHEYFGIHRVWSLNQEYEGDHTRHVTLYFHAKGISHKTFTPHNDRDAVGTRLFDVVVRPWENVLRVFREMPHIDKVGAAYSHAGWVWFNFWWVRGSFCRQLERPIVAERRHYYEDYLCRVPHNLQHPVFRETDRPEIGISPEIYRLRCDNCYSFKLNHAAHPEEAMRGL